ncbi:MAG: universal stress protein [Cocleimonas sp.]
MYNTILIPTDFSDEESTIQALKKAERLSDDGRIVLLHVLADIPAFVLVELPAHIIQEQVPQTKKTLTEMVKKSGVKADIEVRKGQSYNSIIQEAKDIDADLILMNSHQPGLQDYLLGSTAAKVVRHATCSVLVDR